MSREYPVTVKLPFASLPTNAQALLRKVGARKGVTVEVALWAGQGGLSAYYRVEEMASEGEEKRTNTGSMGDDGEWNSSTYVEAAMVAARVSRWTSKSPKTYRLAVSYVSVAAGWQPAAGEFVGAFSAEDTARLAVALDEVEEFGGCAAA